MKMKDFLLKLAPYKDMLENNIAFVDENENKLDCDAIFLHVGDIIIKVS